MADAQKVANVYKELTQSVGEETEAPSDAPVVDFMDWLANELATLGDHMAVGREYASMISLRSFAQALAESGCDHIDKVEIKDPQSYWNAPGHAHDASKRSFDGFWHPGGRDLALLRAAMTRGKVWFFIEGAGSSLCLAKDILMCWKFVLQTPEECATIKEKVKKFIAARNAQEGATGSGSGDVGAPSTPAAEILGKDDMGTPGKNAGQDGVEN